MKKESFVFHAEYIDDLPDQYKTEFAMYAINYAIYEQEPAIDKNSLKYSLWIKIARRIESDGGRYEEISERRRDAAKRRKEQWAKNAGAGYPEKPAEKPLEEKSQDENPAETSKPQENPQEQAAANQTNQPAEKSQENLFEEKSTAQEKAGKFVKPSEEEIAEYCENRKNGIDARTFFNFYEAKGWKVGNQKMKSWQACVRTWEQRRKTADGGGGKKPGGMWENENEVPESVANLF